MNKIDFSLFLFSCTSKIEFSKEFLLDFLSDQDLINVSISEKSGILSS